MANPPAAPNRFLAQMRNGHILLPHHPCSPNINDVEEIEEFAEALLEIGAFESVDIDVNHVAFQVVEELPTHAGIGRLCEALSMISMSTVFLFVGEPEDDLLLPQWQQDELTSIFLRRSVAGNSSVRELCLCGVRVDDTFALVVQECLNLTHVEFFECQVSDRGAYDPIAEALRDSKVESLAFAVDRPRTPFEAHILAAARGFTNLKKLKLGGWRDDRSEKAFFKDNHKTLESLTICFYDDRSIGNASTRLGSTLDLIWESPIRIQSLRLVCRRLESLKDARTLLALVNSEERCLSRLWVEVETSVEVLALILRGLHRNTTLTSLKIKAPRTQGIGVLFGDMLRHNNTLEEVRIQCHALENDDAAAIFGGLENNQFLKVPQLSAGLPPRPDDLLMSNSFTRKAPLHLTLWGNLNEQVLDSLREAIERGCCLTGLELNVPLFVGSASWTQFFQAVGASISLRTLRLGQYARTYEHYVHGWVDGLTTLIDSVAIFHNLTDLEFSLPARLDQELVSKLVDAMGRNRGLENLRVLGRGVG